MKNRNCYLILLLLLGCLSCENKSNHYLEKAESLVEINPDSALIYIDSIHFVSLTEKNLHRYQLVSVQAKDKTRQDLSSDTMILDICGIYDKTDPYKAALIYLYSGKVLEQRNENKSALEEYLKANKTIGEEYSPTKGIIINTIGSMYYKQLDMVEAKHHLYHALRIFEKEDDLKNRMITHNQLGNCFLIEENSDSAFYHYSQCEQLLNQMADYKYKAGILNNLAVAWQVAGKPEIAKKYLQEAIAVETDNSGKAKIYLNLADLSHNKDTFYHYIQNALACVDAENDFLSLSVIYSVISEYEKEEKNFQAALDAQKQKVDYLNKFYHAKDQAALKELQHKYNLSLIEQENMSLLLTMQWLLLGLLLILFLLLLSIFLLSVEKQKVKDGLEHISHLERMAMTYNEEERSLRNYVLSHFQILKKVALLEHQLLPQSSGRKFIKRVNEILYGQDELDWKQLYETMNRLNFNLFDKLQQAFPQLDENEFKICCLSVAGFNNIEIGLIMGYSVNTITAKKATLRKKMGIAPSGNIRRFLNEHFKN